MWTLKPIAIVLATVSADEGLALELGSGKVTLRPIIIANEL